MRCWKCSRIIDVTSIKCPNCGAVTVRKQPNTREGIVLRQIYDDRGAGEVLTNTRYIVPALKDLLEDSDLLCGLVSLSYSAGFGNAYYLQLSQFGAPSDIFYRNIRALLIDRVGLSDSKADYLIKLFDEMIGWEPLKQNEMETPNVIVSDIDNRLPFDERKTGSAQSVLNESKNNTERGNKSTKVNIWRSKPVRIIVSITLIGVILLIGLWFLRGFYSNRIKTYPLGKIEGDTYINSVLGYSCSLRGWTFQRSLMLDSQELLSDKELQVYTDIVARSQTESNSISITCFLIPDKYRTRYTEEFFLADRLLNANEGYLQNITIAGDEYCAAICINVDTDGSTVYEKTFFVFRNDYVYEVTVTSKYVDSTNLLLSYFQSV